MKFTGAIASLAFAIFAMNPAVAGSALDEKELVAKAHFTVCLLYTSPSPRDQRGSRIASCG